MKLLYFVSTLCAIAMADDTNLESVFHTANNKFTANMLFEVAKLNPKKSVVLSAYSVMNPLAQLAFASVGPSHDELLSSIGMPNDNITKAVFSRLESKIRTVRGVELHSASKVYIPLKYHLDPEFASISRDVFHSEVKNVDFSKGVEAVNEINIWVEEQTNHRIKDLVNSNDLGPGTEAVLVNALYFQGTWMNFFKKSNTRGMDFHVSKDKMVKIPMMFNEDTYKYSESEPLKSKILEIPYVGNQSSLVIVLPNEADGIDALLEKIKHLSVLDDETKKLSKRKVEIHIPKFKIDTTTNLKEVLRNMNITKVFDINEARLQKLVKSPPTPLYISSAIQKAFIEVNEEGTEAAAANVFTLSRSASMTNKMTFLADHPFVFFLIANSEMRKNILFSGIFYA